MVTSYEGALRYLWGLKRLGTRPGLAVTHALLSELGNPERSFRSIHITGSKGKGSTAALCASVLRWAGFRTGLYTSPHLLTYRERIAVDGTPVKKAEVVKLVEAVREANEALLSCGAIEREPTFFEVTTVAAYLHFKNSGVEAAAIEVGLGGRLDSTNTLEADVCVVTTLELEHTDILGPTLRHIAREKAGIFHPGAVAVTGVDEGEGLAELEQQALSLGVPLWRQGKEFRVSRMAFDHGSQTIDVTTPLRRHLGLVIPLLGQFQVSNAAMAAAAVDLWARKRQVEIPEEAYQKGFRTVLWPGRLQRLSDHPAFYADAAHTVMSAQEISRAVRELEPTAPRSESTLIFACLKDKRVNQMMEALSSVTDTAILTTVRNERAMPLKEMLAAARGCFQRTLTIPDVEEAISLAKAATGRHGFILATGSIYLVSDVIAAHEGVRVEEPDLSDPLPSHRDGGIASIRSR